MNLSGICIDKITGTFPPYPLSDVERDIHQAFINKGGDISQLPKLPRFVGGDTDVMIGIQYLRYFPKNIFSLRNGLRIYESQFSNVDPGNSWRPASSIHRGS